jgi:uncharacterized protein with NAD-binding domain and iron-sulfur cluster
LTQPTKVAVLGGGVGGMTAAFELTATPELRERFDVTVYQLGWRNGGKGASGRNAAIADRIEEHGLHVWFGFYDNAFRLMRDAYEELGRERGTPLATFDDAFKGCDELILYDPTTGRATAGTRCASTAPATSCARATPASYRPSGRSPRPRAALRSPAGAPCATSATTSPRQRSTTS